MSPGQVDSDINLQEPETNKSDCPVADGAHGLLGDRDDGGHFHT